jgi:hypothetical protein
MKRPSRIPDARLLLRARLLRDAWWLSDAPSDPARKPLGQPETEPGGERRETILVHLNRKKRT